MRYRALEVSIGPTKRRVGLLFQYGEGRTAITRLVPDTKYWMDDRAPLLSLNALVRDPAQRAAFLAEYTVQPFFNGDGESLPTFFQNLLPEGPLRRHLEELGELGKDDHFGLLSMCGTDLPGAVYVAPAKHDSASVASIVTQDNDALEMSVVPMPVPEATSLSGVQPKLSLIQSGGRYVARTKDAKGVHIIAKLPTVEYPLLPQVEELSMRMAAAAGVNVCEVSLQPLENIDADQPFVLGDGKEFLAVRRFDRDRRKHVHCEDFAQILGVPPDLKYSHRNASYAAMLTLLAHHEALGLDAVHEMLRRIAVNDMLGNFDGHLKNFGLLYRDGRTPELSPAYDVVAYSAFIGGSGHALPFVSGGAKRSRVTPAVVRELCNNVRGLHEPQAHATIRQTVRLACEAWPAMVEASSLRPEQKTRLLSHFQAAPLVAAWEKRSAKRGAPPRHG